MKGIIYLTKRLAWIVVLVALFSGALALAQDQSRPEITQIADLKNYPDVIIVEWTQPKGVAGVEIFVKGPGRWMPKNHGGWIAAENPTHVRDQRYQYAFFKTMPGKTYSFRIRAVDDNGNKGKASKPHKHRKIPCWVYRSHYEGGEPFSNNRGPMPDRWKVKNTRYCKGVDVTGQTYTPPVEPGE